MQPCGDVPFLETCDLTSLTDLQRDVRNQFARLDADRGWHARSSPWYRGNSTGRILTGFVIGGRGKH